MDVMKRWRPSLDRVLACSLLLGLAGRIFVPAGFMVGPGDGAWPVVLCPGVTPDSHAATGHGSHSADHGRSEDPEEQPYDGDDSACFLGVFFALAAEVDAVDVAPFRLPETRYHAPSGAPSVGAGVAAAPRPRGPPAPLSIPA
jgi:hypothetical protein